MDARGATAVPRQPRRAPPGHHHGPEGDRPRSSRGRGGLPPVAPGLKDSGGPRSRRGGERGSGRRGVRATADRRDRSYGSAGRRHGDPAHRSGGVRGLAVRCPRGAAPHPGRGSPGALRHQLRPQQPARRPQACRHPPPRPRGPAGGPLRRRARGATADPRRPERRHLRRRDRSWSHPGPPGEGGSHALRAAIDVRRWPRRAVRDGLLPTGALAAVALRRGDQPGGALRLPRWRHRGAKPARGRGARARADHRRPHHPRPGLLPRWRADVRLGGQPVERGGVHGQEERGPGARLGGHARSGRDLGTRGASRRRAGLRPRRKGRTDLRHRRSQLRRHGRPPGERGPLVLHQRAGRPRRRPGPGLRHPRAPGRLVRLAVVLAREPRGSPPEGTAGRPLGQGEPPRRAAPGALGLAGDDVPRRRRLRRRAWLVEPRAAHRVQDHPHPDPGRRAHRGVRGFPDRVRGRCAQRLGASGGGGGRPRRRTSGDRGRRWDRVARGPGLSLGVS